jgi:hypothetical protein
MTSITRLKFKPLIRTQQESLLHITKLVVVESMICFEHPLAPLDFSPRSSSSFYPLIFIIYPSHDALGTKLICRSIPIPKSSNLWLHILHARYSPKHLSNASISFHPHRYIHIHSRQTKPIKREGPQIKQKNLIYILFDPSSNASCYFPRVPDPISRDEQRL